MRKLKLLLACLLVASIGLVNAQTRTASGTVVSAEDGQPIIGASVKVKGTTTGTSTNAEGKFSFNITSGNTLVISYVGMKTQEVGVGSNLMIRLVGDDRVIDEVVVTAMGIKKERKALGYSVQSVNSEELTKANNPDLVTSLSGKVAGLEIRQSSGMPGAPAEIFLRGARSFSGNNSPLYVVDGMPITSTADYNQTGNESVTGAAYSNRALDIDPNNIESINVLKGQAASALYGIRASNGVVVIITKSGKNAKKGRPEISISSNYSFDNIARLPEVQQTYAQGSYGKYGPVGSFSWGPLISDLSKNATYGGDAQGHPGLFFNSQKGTWETPTAYNNPKAFFQTGATKNNSINVSQSGDFGSFNVGLSASNQNGIVSAATMDRYSANASGTINLSKKWILSFSSNYSDLSLSKLPSGNDSWLFTVYGAPPSYDLMGTPYHMPQVNALDNTYMYRQISYRRGSVGENPLWAIENNHYLEKVKRFFGNVGINYNPIDWVNIRYQLGIDTHNSDLEDLTQMGSAHTGQVLPTAYLTPTNSVYQFRTPTGGKIDKYGLTARTINSLLSVTFSKQLAENLNGSLMIGNEINDENTSDWSMSGTGFVKPGWNNMQNTLTQLAYGNQYRSRSIGVFTNLSMDYLNMLYLNASFRGDRVSAMPNGSRTFYYPSVSLGFVFTELSPLKQNKILSFGKIRGSYAEVGQAGKYQENYYVKSGAGSGMLTDGIDFPLGGVSGFAPYYTYFDPNIKPQNTKTIELGAELRFFNNRIGIDYNFSSQKTIDQMYRVPIAPSSGYSYVYMNGGDMSSIAHEIMFNVTPIRTKDINWDVNVNFTKVKNICNKLAPGVTNISLGGYVDPNVRASAGDTYPAIYGTQFKRDAQGRILVDEDPKSDYYGMPLSGGFGKIGVVSPNFIMGFSSAFRYSIATLSFQLDWKQGGQMYSGSNRLMDLYGTSKKTEARNKSFIYDGYKADGSKNDIERGKAGDEGAYQDLYTDVLSAIAEAYIYETSYLKLREISLSLSLPKKATPKWMTFASLTFSARNILMWTTLPNFDPETSQGMGNMAGGFDYMSLPQTKSFGIGLNVKF